MRNQNGISFPLAAVLMLALGTFIVPCVAQAKNVSQTAMAGAYSVTLKVLPAESFSGPHAEMMRDGGAKADMVNGPGRPNHHLVAFIAENGKPVEKAKVTISYRKLSPKPGKMMRLPVARMHVVGKGLATTHFGNNVSLGPGSYEVHVTVNGKGPATFHFSL